MSLNAPDIIVIGGGPAGMAAALFARRAGARALLLEQNEKLGKKLYITGKGRCNLTNQANREDFLANVPRNPRFLHAALSFLPPDGLRTWLKELGCDTVVERGQRVFPATQKASDVIKALSQGLADVRLRCPVSAVLTEAGRATGVQLQDGSRIAARAVILATGGVSYPLTGSRGEGHRMAKALGHRVSALVPALVGLYASDGWIAAVQGLSLKNVVLGAARNGKTRFAQQGEMLFTHQGISGPLALSLSSLLAGGPWADTAAWIDLKPALDRDALQSRLQRDVAEKGRRQFSSLLPEYLPASLARVFPGLCGVPADKQLSQLTTDERSRFVETLKRLPLHLTGPGPFEEAVITRGGVEVKEVSPSTMASRKVAGLYFAGEILDVDALTGGFNLQIAFSTGALAGASAARHIMNQ